jgi:MoxR-like ATPase
MVLAGKVTALLDGRPNVSIADIRQVAVAALRHRMVVGYEATADNVDAAQLVDALLETVGAPTAGMRGAP